MEILFCEDSLKHRRAGVKQLLALGHTVASFSSYVEARESAQAAHYDVALLDLFMPAEGMSLSLDATREFLGASMPIGFPMVISLAMLKIPRILVATEVNLHNHPMSVTLDWLGDKPFKIDDSWVVLMHAEMVDGVKNWAKMLNLLIDSTVFPLS